MPTTSLLEVRKLNLDLKNFRTVPQKKESDAIKAMIAISPDRFFAIMESIIEDGYIPTENIIVLNEGIKPVVKEGNRRIACLKLIHGQYKAHEFGIPNSVIDKISNLDSTWKRDNLNVPCTIFEFNEADKADKVVALAHGKGERASREGWSSVATARHNRDAKGIAEPALDLLEKYLKNSNNANEQFKNIWAGDYPLTVLHEAIRFIHLRLGFDTFNDLVSEYPKIENVNNLDNLIRDIGLKLVQFKTIRNTNEDFALNYGVLPIKVPTNATNPSTIISTNPTASNSNPVIQQSIQAETTAMHQETPIATTNTQNSSTTASPKAIASNDPRQIAILLKKFTPRGDRSKVVSLRDEMRKLKIKDNPLAFCFLLRSMFEISAKKYCTENSIPLKHPPKNGKPPQDKTLADILKDVYKNLIQNDSDKSRTKSLHGAYTEITKPEGILSVTSMNNLVHNPSFSVQPNDICTLFGNIYPLLEAIN